MEKMKVETFWSLLFLSFLVDPEYLSKICIYILAKNEPLNLGATGRYILSICLESGLKFVQADFHVIDTNLEIIYV